MNPLSRREAIRAVVDALPESAVVFANGYISREGYGHRDAERHFYMLGSMGLAASIGLGVALTAPSRHVAVIDGDGSVLMALGTLPMVGAWHPRRFLHVVLDNGTYGSTGAQETISSAINLAAAALASGYAGAESVLDESALLRHVVAAGERDGPFLLHVPISATEGLPAPRVPYEPEVIASRFASAISHEAIRPQPFGRRLETNGRDSHDSR